MERFLSLNKGSVISISGKQGSGKSTVSSILRKRFTEELFLKSHILKIATVVYECHDLMVPLLKERGIMSESVVKNGTLLQAIGESMRREYGERVLVDHFIDKILLPKIDCDTVVLIDDLRTKAELTALKSTLKVRLECSEDVRKERCSSWRNDSGHITETDLDEYVDVSGVFDLIIRTDDNSAEEVVDKIFNFWRSKIYD